MASQNVRKAIAFSAISTYFGQFLGFLTVIIVARMLTPQELGVYAIAASLVIIAGELTSFGVGNYLIRKEDLSTNDIKSALGFNILIAGFLGTLLLIFSTTLENFYDKPDISSLIQIMAINFFIMPHTGIAKALMAKHFLFKRIALINVFAQLSQICITVILILCGYSYFSLALAAVASSLVQLCFIAKLRSVDHVWIPHFKNLLIVGTFGVYVTFSNLLRKMSKTIPDLIIGKMGSSLQVALFSRGIGFVDFLQETLVSGIRPVVLPYFSQQKRFGLGPESSYLKSCNMVNVILLPALTIAGLASKPVIVLLFGEQWLGSAALVALLCVWCIFRTLHTFAPSLLITHGYEKIMFTKELVIFIFTAAMIYIGFHYSLKGVALGFAIAGILDFVLTGILMQMLMGIYFYKFIKCMLPNIYIALLCGLATICVDLVVDFDATSALVSILVLLPAVGGIWLAALFLFRHPFISELSHIKGLEWLRKVKVRELY